jgi:hypothetical protein
MTTLHAGDPPFSATEHEVRGPFETAQGGGGRR